jgi:uncharacterized membrane protein
MFGRTKTDAVKDKATSATELAAALARDRKFRKQLVSAMGYGAVARRRAARRIGLLAAIGRMSDDAKLRGELREATTGFQKAWSRVQKKRSHRLRKTLIVIAAGGAAVAAALPQSRRSLVALVRRSSETAPRTITESIEVDVPVSTAYNQWTQFEDFPLFMEGVEHVEQRDDTRLHWVATVAGRRAEWDAKIVEQHPDREISWISEDGKETRGTVRFEPRGEAKTSIQFTMSYKPEGLGEEIGSSAGLDERRVRGDLERFKELIESRGAETGAWRGEITTQPKTE